MYSKLGIIIRFWPIKALILDDLQGVPEINHQLGDII